MESHDGMNKSIVGEWEDQRCQENIVPETKLSQLCNACRHIFTTSVAWTTLKSEAATGGSRISATCRHIKRKSVLELSARRGCSLCNLLSTLIERDATKTKSAFKGRTYYQLDVGTSGDLNISFTYVHENAARLKGRSEKMNFTLEPRPGQ